jgi:hypothetical protein
MADDETLAEDYAVAVELVTLALAEDLESTSDEMTEVVARVLEMDEPQLQRTLVAMTYMPTVLLRVFAPGREEGQLQAIAVALAEKRFGEPER